MRRFADYRKSKNGTKEQSGDRVAGKGNLAEDRQTKRPSNKRPNGNRTKLIREITHLSERGEGDMDQPSGGKKDNAKINSKNK